MIQGRALRLRNRPHILKRIWQVFEQLERRDLLAVVELSERSPLTMDRPTRWRMFPRVLIRHHGGDCDPNSVRR